MVDLNNSSEQNIYFSVNDDIKILGAGVKKDGSIDGVVVGALFLQNSEPYVSSKFYFKPKYDDWGDIYGFLYLGELQEK